MAGYVAFNEFAIQIFGIDIIARSMPPVGIVELDLHEIPVYAVVHGQYFIKHVRCSVKRKPQVPDTPGLAFFHQKINHTVVDVPCPECLDAAIADGVQQIIIDVVHLQVLERFPIHGN